MTEQKQFLKKMTKSISNLAISQEDVKNNATYLRLAYWAIFEREIDEDGLNGWLKALENGLSRTELIKHMVSSREFFNKIIGSSGMDQIFHKLHLARIEMVQSLLPSGNTILDIGGYSTADQKGSLLSMGYPYLPKKLYILDLPPDQMMFPGPTWPNPVNYQNCKIEYVYRSMTDLSHFPKKSFDLIWSGESIEHISQQEAEQVLAQSYELLKPGGKLALDTPNRRATELLMPNSYIHPEHKLEYYFKDLSAMLSKHKFRIVQSKGIIDLSKSIAASSLLNFYQECLSSANINDNPDNSFCFYICCERAED